MPKGERAGGRRLGLHRLSSLHRSTREVIRYERAAPGELVHLHVKKLRRIPDGGGKRFDPGFSGAERLATLPAFLDEYNGQRPHTALGGLTPLTRICQ